MMEAEMHTLRLEEQALQQLIVFRTGHQEFCVPIESVQEIIKVGHITPIPDAPPFVCGLIDVRGDVVAIIDVKARFLLKRDETKCKHIIITKHAGGLYGLMVDEVLEVLRVKATDINMTSKTIANLQRDFVKAVVVYEGRLIILLDLLQVLTPEDMVKMSRVTHDVDEKQEMKEAKHLTQRVPTVRASKEKKNE